MSLPHGLTPAESLVSIVIPVFNGSDYLAEAIDSALAQTWPHVEVIVVDDGSDDDGRTAAIARRYGERIRYERKANGGVATAVNTGIRLMRGQYLSWLSHDDVYAPDKVERQLRALLQLGRPAMAFGDFATMDDQGANITEYRTGEGHDPTLPLLDLLNYRINGCATLIHRDCLGGGLWLDPGMPTTQDYDLWFRIVRRFPLLHVPGIAVYHRLHANQGSRGQRHLDEVALLWASVFDRLPPAHLNEGQWLQIMQAGAVAHSAGLRRLVGMRVRSLVARRTLALVLTGGQPLGAVEALAQGLRALGIELRGVWCARASDSQLESLTLQWEDGTQTPVHLIGSEVQNLAGRLLSACSAATEADCVWLVHADQESAPDPLSALLKLGSSPGSVACLTVPATGAGASDPLGVLSGAVFRTWALRRALADAPDALGALVYALARLGELSHVSAPAVHAQPVSVLKQAGADAPAPTVIGQPPSLAWPMRLSMSLLRRPVWAGVTWRAMRLGLPGLARRKLLRWTGLEGWMDPDWYLRAYPDVAAEGIDPVFHYLLFGHAEGRDPAPHFNTRAYLAEYPQVKQQGFNPLQHYVAWGRFYGYGVQPSELGAQPPVADGAREALLLVLDQDDARTLRFARDLAQQIAPRLRVLYLVGRGERADMVLGADPEGRWGRRFEFDQPLLPLSRVLAVMGVHRALVLGERGFGARLTDVLRATACSFDWVDFSASGPQGDAAGLSERLFEPDRQWLRASAEHVFMFSRAQAQAWSGAEFEARIRIAPAPDPNRLRGFRPWPRPVDSSAPLNIGLFGRLGENEGRQRVIELLGLIRDGGWPLRLCLFGQAVPALPAELGALLRVVQANGPAELTQAVLAERIHLAWLPHDGPVPCNYALTDAEALGLPVVATRVGEITERLQGRALTSLYPDTTDAAQWLAVFLRLQREGLGGEAEVEEPFGNRFHDADVFRQHLYARL